MAADGYMELFEADNGVTVEGETTDEAFRNTHAFEISSFDWSVSKPEDDPSDAPAGGADRGAVAQRDKEIGTFEIGKWIDLATTDLFRACMKKTEFGRALITVRETGEMKSEDDTPFKPYLKLHFGHVQITQFQWGLTPGETGDDSHEEKVTFSFGQVRIEYCRQRETGEHRGPKFGGWDRWSPKHKEW